MVYLTDSANNWLLPVGVFLPVAGMVVMGFIPRTEERLLKVVALLTALATAAIGVVTLATFDYDKAGTLQFYVNEPWIDAIRSRFIMGCDGMSLPLYILTMAITLLCIIYSWITSPSRATRRPSSC
jgi:NADH-quinone oxidoreductase subunit M